MVAVKCPYCCRSIWKN